MIEPVLGTMMGDGVELHYALWEGQGTPVVCIHGLTANCRNWDVVANVLAPDYRVLAMDLRGRGGSGQPPSGYAIDQHCRDIAALLKGLGIGSCSLMGHSLGALISLAYAAQYPEQVERIILIDGGGKLSDDQTTKILAAIRLSVERLGKVFSSFEAYRDYLRQTPLFGPWRPAMDTFFRHDIEPAGEGIRSRIRASAIEEEVRSLKEYDVDGVYREVRCPVLILRATEGMLDQTDILLPEDVQERMLRELTGARLVDLEANHYTVMFQENEARNQAIRTFLAEQE